MNTKLEEAKKRLHWFECKSRHDLFLLLVNAEDGVLCELSIEEWDMLEGDNSSDKATKLWREWQKTGVEVSDDYDCNAR